MSRAQRILPAAAVAAASLWVCWISFTQQPAEAYLFPRLISIFFVGFSLWTLAAAAVGKTDPGQGIAKKEFLNLLPGLIVMAIYVFWAAEALGFYASATLAFFAIFSLYDSAPHREVKSWLKRILATACFSLAMYGLFALLLQVFTPRGLLL